MPAPAKPESEPTFTIVCDNGTGVRSLGPVSQRRGSTQLCVQQASKHGSHLQYVKCGFAGDTVPQSFPCMVGTSLNTAEADGKPKEVSTGPCTSRLCTSQDKPTLYGV